MKKTSLVKAVIVALALMLAFGAVACTTVQSVDAAATEAAAEATQEVTQEQPIDAVVPTATPYTGEVRNVVFWHSLSGSAGDELMKIVEEYNAGQGAQNGIYVEAVYQGYEGTDKVILAYQTNDTENACDINVGLTSTIPSMLALDWTTKVSDMIAKGGSAVSEDTFYPAMVRSVTYQNEMIALPFLNSTMLMYYNVDALKEAGYDAPPATFDELAAYTEALTQKDASGNVTRYGFECQVKRYQLVNFCVSQSTDSFFGDMEGGRAGAMTKLVCNEDGTLKNFLEKLAAINATGGYQYTENKINEEFAAGTTAIAVMSSSKIGSVAGLVNGAFQWMTAPIPKVNAGDTSSAAVGGSCLVLFNRGDDDRTAAAWDFMQYLSSADSQSRISMATGYIPTNVESAKTESMATFYEQNPQYLVALNVIKDGNPLAQEPMDLTYNEINSVITNVMLQFCQGELSADEAVQQIGDQCNQLLNDWHEAND